MAQDVIPAGALCTEICVFDEVVIIDYRLDDVRYLVSYYADGKVEKIARQTESDIIYSVDSVDGITDSYNATENQTTKTLPEEAARRMETMINEGWEPASCYPIDSVTKWNTFVETYQVNSQGKITMIWEYDSSTENNNPIWGHSVQCEALNISNYEILRLGEESYSAQILLHGFWTTGVGNGFGY